jgi:hypothetical protein
MKHLLDSFLYEGLKSARIILGGDANALDRIQAIDCSPTKKYADWLAKNYKKTPFVDDTEIGDLIAIYNELCNKGKLDRRDINSFNSIVDLSTYINNQKKTGATHSKMDLYKDYEVILDNKDVYMVMPLNHEAARKLGMRYFSDERNIETNKKPDCRWCVTFKDSGNWDEHFYGNCSSLYFIKFKNPKIKFPNNKVCVMLTPKNILIKDSKTDPYSRLKIPLEGRIYYFDATDNFGRDYDNKDVNHPQSATYLDRLIKDHGIEKLIQFRYLKERFYEENLIKNSVDPKLINMCKLYYPEFFDPDFKITISNKEADREGRRVEGI